jgi:hypothetical protein
MADEETEIKPQDLPRPVHKWMTALKVLGGVAAIPLLMLLGEYLLGMVGDGIEHVNAIGDRVTTLEANASSRDAIWTAIHKNENDLADSVERNHSMEVKYEAAMLVFEKHFMGGGCMKQGTPSAHSHSDAVLETLQKTLAEVQKAETADKGEIKKLQEELKKMRDQQSKDHEDSKRQAELLEALKNIRKAGDPVKKLNAEQFRKLYEEKFPVQQQQQLQKPR